MYHAAVMKFDEKRGRGPRSRLQVHFFQLLHRPKKKSREALNYTPPSASRSGTLSTATSESVSLERDPFDDRVLSVAEAAALLEGREYAPKKVTFMERIQWLEHLIRSPTSIFAMKTSAAASVFTILILAQTTSAFFVSYALTGGVLTLIVSISPTLG